ncbi:MAG: trehalose-phosphatase [Candidatus Omnitrophota bacterium]
MNRQPSSFFDNLPDIQKRLSEKEIVFFLDYDGTLTPIVATPDLAVLSEDMRQTLRELIKRYKVSIVSGRATDDVKGKVKLDGIFYAGSHGFEIVYPSGEVKINEQAQKIRSVIDEAHAKLEKRLAGIKGALAEHVKYTISAHYRLVADTDFPQFEKIVDETVREYPSLRKSSGKKVFELKPKIDWHKGKAVEWILKVIGTGENILPIYIGDDTTDEDAFRVLRDKGFGILVADPVRASVAEYVIKNAEEVKKVLKFFIGLKSTDDHR